MRCCKGRRIKGKVNQLYDMWKPCVCRISQGAGATKWRKMLSTRLVSEIDSPFLRVLLRSVALTFVLRSVIDEAMNATGPPQDIHSPPAYPKRHLLCA